MKKIFLFLIVFLLIISISNALCDHGVTIDGQNFDCSETDNICVDIVLGDDDYCSTNCNGIPDPDCVTAVTKKQNDEACTSSNECQSGYCIGPNWHCGSPDKYCYFNNPSAWLSIGQSTATSPFIGGQNICWSQCVKETCTQAINYPECETDKNYCTKYPVTATNLECRNDENGDDTWQLPCSGQTTCDSTNGKCKSTVTPQIIEEKILNDNCNDGIDNDDDNEWDYDTLDRGPTGNRPLKGDKDCSIEITGISAPSKASSNSDIKISCSSSVPEINSLQAFIIDPPSDPTLCTFDDWQWSERTESLTTAKFICSVGAEGEKTIKCTIDTTKSYQSGEDKTQIITVSAACNTNTDFDCDGILNNIDDSDDNGILDSIEGNQDTDNDRVPNYQDYDNDGNGIVDTEEIGPDPDNPIDTDKDGTPDYNDIDNDGDGFTDLEEIGAGSNYNDPLSIPIQCVITSAAWANPTTEPPQEFPDNTEISEQTQITLVLTGTNCVTSTLNLELWEDDSGFGDDQILGQSLIDINFPQTIKFEQGATAAKTSWTTKWLKDTDGITDNPEFKFKATGTDKFSKIIIIKQVPASITCTESWSCSSWSPTPCPANGQQTRTCTCACAGGIGCSGSSSISQSCYPPTQPVCTAAGTCENNKYCNADGLSETDCSLDPTKNGCCLTNLGCKTENTFLNLNGKKCYNKDWITAACATDNDCTTDESCQNTDQGFKCVDLCSSNPCCWCYTKCREEMIKNQNLKATDKKPIRDDDCSPHTQFLATVCD